MIINTLLRNIGLFLIFLNLFSNCYAGIGLSSSKMIIECKSGDKLDFESIVSCYNMGTNNITVYVERKSINYHLPELPEKYFTFQEIIHFPETEIAGKGERIKMALNIPREFFGEYYVCLSYSSAVDNSATIRESLMQIVEFKIVSRTWLEYQLYCLVKFFRRYLLLPTFLLVIFAVISLIVKWMKNNLKISRR